MMQEDFNKEAVNGAAARQTSQQLKKNATGQEETRVQKKAQAGKRIASTTKAQVREKTSNSKKTKAQEQATNKKKLQPSTKVERRKTVQKTFSFAGVNFGNSAWRENLHKIRYVVVLAAVFCCVLGGLGLWRFWRSDFVQMRLLYLWDYQQEIILYSERNKIDPFLVAAIIKNESGFNNKAVSESGAVGLMQIMPETGRWIAAEMGLKQYKDRDLYRSETNIRMGCWYVGELEHEFGRNQVLTLIAYNAGRGQTKAWIQGYGWNAEFCDVESIPYEDTREYVRRVLADRDQYYRYYREHLTGEKSA